MLGCEWACEGLWECWVVSGHVRVCRSGVESGYVRVCRSVGLRVGM